MTVGVVGWLAFRTVRVETTDEKVLITIDKHKLHDAAGELQDRGRRTADRVGRTLEEAGRQLHDSANDASRR
ncbi:MAG TPA: hypothetical protein VFW87_17535 [Pirellulales bacterium]|nr:hypothetical protein [Pirellulales bacterium]